MKRIMCILFLIIFTIGVVGCGINGNEVAEGEETDVLNSKKSTTLQTVSEDEIKNQTYKSERTDSFSFDYDTIIIDDEFFEKNPDVGFAVVKIKPVEYSFFTYISDSGKREYEKKDTELLVDVEKVITSRGNIDLQIGQSITLIQHLTIYPTADYWNDFITVYGGENKTLECVPSGLYKHDNEKLDKFGIYTISTFDDTPILQCGESYYAYVYAHKTESGTDYYSNLYCDDNYDPVTAGGNGEKNYSTLSSTGFSEQARKFAEMVKEYEK